MQLKHRRGKLARLAAAVALSASLVGVLATSASAAPRHRSQGLVSHGALVHIVKPGLGINASQSTNWSGYNQSAIEKGKLFTSVTGQWTVPTATQHTKGQAESSSDWIGIGGGCLDAGCVAIDPTLIQTGTEQDVDASGKASYSAWWELVPAPSLTISNMAVSPGDTMQASVAEVVPLSNLWTITLKDVTKGETFSQTVPYTSTHGTAEWIQETPLLIGTNAGFASQPNLTSPNFDLGTANGSSPGLTSSEEIQLTDSNGTVIGTPSAPDSDTDGFGVCAWATSCSAPGS